MPQETLSFPPLYCVVGAYRLAHDPSLWRPMWAKCSQAAKHASIVGLIWAVCTWPFQRLFVHYFMSASASMSGFNALYGKMVQTADVTDDNLPFRIPLPSLQTFATFMFVIGQVHAIMEFWLRRKLRECRNTAYVQTVRSRGKGADWWTEYVEEFSNPPTHKAIKDAKKQAWYLKLASPLVRFAILKVFLLPMDFVPLFGMALGAALRSLSYGRLLHKSFFEAKKMSPFQIELWITERQSSYRAFGFVAALMERIPLIGLVFSVSNRIGAAMWAHDLEKRQQSIRQEKVGLEEFKTKPTLKKIYKNVQQESNATTSGTETASASAIASGGHTDATAEGNFNGEGLAVLRRCQGMGVFTHLSFTFPLKLICASVSSRNATRDPLVAQPRTTSRDGQAAKTTTSADARATDHRAMDVDGSGARGKAVTALYLVGYGGGLVSGDSVALDVDVGSDCTLLMLTQGSTKVFKTRTTSPTVGVSTSSFTALSASSSPSSAPSTQQTLRFLVRSNATLVLLPDPVTCFASAQYDQVQRFDLRAGASCIVLDWLTPGRTAVSAAAAREARLNHLDAHSPLTGGPLKDYSVAQRAPELWAFSSYRSRNEIRLNGTVVARDTILLSQSPQQTWTDALTGWDFTDLARRNHPFGCYATLLLAGPDAQALADALHAEFEHVQQRPVTNVDEVLWSVTALEPGVAVVRLAGRDSSRVRSWLYHRLASLEHVVGRDLYRQALAG